MNKIRFLKVNENGSVIVITIMILALMTIIGLSATKMASIESLDAHANAIKVRLKDGN